MPEGTVAENAAPFYGSARWSEVKQAVLDRADGMAKLWVPAEWAIIFHLADPSVDLQVQQMMGAGADAAMDQQSRRLLVLLFVERFAHELAAQAVDTLGEQRTAAGPAPDWAGSRDEMLRRVRGGGFGGIGGGDGD